MWADRFAQATADTETHAFYVYSYIVCGDVNGDSHVQCACYTVSVLCCIVSHKILPHPDIFAVVIPFCFAQRIIASVISIANIARIIFLVVRFAVGSPINAPHTVHCVCFVGSCNRIYIYIYKCVSAPRSNQIEQRNEQKQNNKSSNYCLNNSNNDISVHHWFTADCWFIFRDGEIRAARLV